MEQAGIQRAPCASCPYRQDVPSGLWSSEEYDKIVQYDRPTPEQPSAVFMCHQQNGCLCRGWVDTHGSELLALRVAASRGSVDVAAVSAALGESPAVPVFATATDAAVHGRKDIKAPKARARKMIEVLQRKADARNEEFRKRIVTAAQRAYRKLLSSQRGVMKKRARVR